MYAVVLSYVHQGHTHCLSGPDKKGNRDNLRRIFLIAPYKSYITCDPKKEPSHRDGSYEGSQCMFLVRSKKNYL